MVDTTGLASTISRTGRVVSVNLQCQDVLEAVDLYRRLCKEIDSGGASVEIKPNK